ncbi:hypothetical protein M5K25_008222 [Dendrobium thyrsiflorum]|uniref:Uncharacterized protein n=1 Tax=Dendrobium thyrsiflorum TaxID=117978 RepID=A0ABD0V836_DENTH
MAPGKRISSRIIANYSHLFEPSNSNNVQSTLKDDASHVLCTANNGDLSTGEASPITDSLGLPPPTAPENETTINVSTTNKKRGPNRGVALEEHYRTKGKISIFIPEGLNRPVGEHHSKLSREAGIIIRNFAPMQVERWDKISDIDKEILLKKLMMFGTSQSYEHVKIDLSIEESHVKECVMHTMSKRFSDFRSKAYVHYKKLGGGMLARKKPYKELMERPDDWIWLCNFFESETFKKKSESNSRNRSMLKFVHRMGTKSLVAHLYEQKLSRIKLYKEEFTDKEKKWVSEDCRAKYSKIIKCQQKTIDWLKMVAEKMGMQPPNDDGANLSNEENGY